MKGNWLRMAILVPTVVLALASGCGPGAASPIPTQSKPGPVYHVAVAILGMPSKARSAMGTVTEWADPAANRYRTQVGPGKGKVLDAETAIGAPGVEEVTTTLGKGTGLPPADRTNTWLSYGRAGAEGGLALPSYSLPALRCYLGIVKGASCHVRVEHARGRVVLIAPMPATPVRSVPLVEKLAREFGHARVQITILGTISRAAARKRGLFTIVPAKADATSRLLAPGVRPSAPTPAYWVGASWDGQKAVRALSVTGSHAGADDYQVWYGSDPVPFSGKHSPPGLSIDTTDNVLGFPSPTATQIAGTQKVTLADGSKALFMYVDGRNGSMSVATVTLVGGGPSSTSTQVASPSAPEITVFVGREQIEIDAQPGLSRAQTLGLVRTLRPV